MHSMYMFIKSYLYQNANISNAFVIMKFILTNYFCQYLNKFKNNYFNKCIINQEKFCK
jgi:hypothetical protein